MVRSRHPHPIPERNWAKAPKSRQGFPKPEPLKIFGMHANLWKWAMDFEGK
jgi:hypothetical protein